MTEQDIKYPLTLETQHLRLKLAEAEARSRETEAEAEERSRKMAWRMGAVMFGALLYSAAITAGFCFTSARHDATIQQMTAEHAKAMKTALNAQSRNVKYQQHSEGK